MAKDLAIVLNSGSVNSAVTTSLASQRYRVVMLHAEIGAGTGTEAGSRLRAAYDQQVAHFKPYREHSLPMGWLAAIQEPRSSAAALASDPRSQGVHLGQQLLDLLPLLSAALRYAVHYQASAVYLGLRVGGSGDELATATEYSQIWNELVQMPCGYKDLEVITPLLELECWQVIDVGFQVNTPFERTWSCLEQSTDPCWACPGCKAREKAFQQAGKIDPTRITRKA
jgi:7-cyano-7-deazaguanine synthase in queuosine biosynthesis